ncbi:MAG TPA: thioredoxin-like domain-containing protein [Gammaproteobacteria bacterium]|nr:thioredoxin-like domain-containing protein [Gammaproteobacteria bacterium]
MNADYSPMKRAMKIAVVLAGLVAIVLLVMGLPAHQALAADTDFRGEISAPSFPEGLDWINTTEPLTWEKLKGRVVLLDFWTYGCVNCMHIIPELKKLKQKYGNKLVVIGVHSAKFEHESKTENIKQVALRYGREAPIVNDKNFQIWDSYGVRAWPTLVLVDPNGNIIGKVAGEGHAQLLDTYIAGTISAFGDQVKQKPLPFDTGLVYPDTPLLFPGKIIADEKRKRLFIADSNHNRIVVTDFDGTVLRVIGSGEQGLQDGRCAVAEFDQPQGMTLVDANTLYVADTFNSAIRRVEFDEDSCTVTTVAGTGEQKYLVRDQYKAENQPLNTPWDVLWHDGLLYIAMAGQHQIWTYNPDTDVIEVFAGDRREALDDGPRLEASFNQPSGLAYHDGVLYVADAEASAIRAIDLKTGEVSTLVGTGLFDFGDRDGVGDEVLLQHPLGVAWAQTRLYLVDTYNDKLKTLDPETRRVNTVTGGFDEPGGLAVADNKVFIADTNNHAIKVYHMQRGIVSKLTLEDPNNLLE